MGSNQSVSEESFSIDPTGKITHKNLSETPQQTQVPEFTPPPPPPPSEPKEVEMSLSEAEQVLTHMKARYKLNQEDMVGKSRSMFEEVERNLASCYMKNKNQPLNCLAATEEYKQTIRQQRNLVLKRSLAGNLMTTIISMIVVMTCIIVHCVSPIACYGASSIDLGSEWMRVGLVAPGVPMDIVLNEQSQRQTPMAIAFSNGERYVGDPALDIASKYPERTFTHFLDLVGKTVDDESVKHYKKRFPHADISSHEPNSTSIILNHPQGLSFTPLELVAMMFEHAHDQISRRLASNEPASDVVITIPPFFGDREKQVILDAAKVVGLNVLRLTSVNSAFALSYGIFRHTDYLPKSSDNKTSILFFDQGASHTSATLADYHLIEHGSNNETLPTVTVRAQVYDRFLGGFDMQLRLRDFLVDTFATEKKIDKSRIYKRGRSASKVLKEAGRVKRILSANTNHLVRIENVIDDKDFAYRITREQFEDMNKDLIGERVTSLLDRLFELPDVSREDKLESIIIVGGNTRTPKLQQVLTDYFKLESVGKSINADEGAALAALYQAASLGRGFRVKKYVLEEFNQGNDTSSQAIYSESELKRIGEKLAKLREQDYERLQRLSLINSLESLINEGPVGDIGNKIKEWLEEGPQTERDNITLLAEKYTELYELIHPKPSTTPAPPPIVDLPAGFNLSDIDFANVLNRSAATILDALGNLTNSDEASPDPQSAPTSSASPEPSTINKDPPHSDL